MKFKDLTAGTTVGELKQANARIAELQNLLGECEDENTRLMIAKGELEARLKEAEGQRDGLRVEVKEAHALVAELRARLKEMATAEGRDYENLRDRFDAAEADAGRLREALEQYANKENWHHDGQLRYPRWQGSGRGSDIAQAALSPAKGEESEGK